MFCLVARRFDDLANLLLSYPGEIALGEKRKERHHAAGCRRWFNALRDTTTDQFLATYRAGESMPAIPAGCNGRALTTTLFVC